MTDVSERLSEIRERVEAATEGPWTTRGEVVGWLGGKAPAVAVNWWEGSSGSPVCMVQPEGSIQCGSDPVGGSPNPPEDAEFIAAARKDVPYLPSLVEGVGDEYRSVKSAASEALAMMHDTGMLEDGHPAAVLLKEALDEAKTLNALRDAAQEGAE